MHWSRPRKAGSPAREPQMTIPELASHLGVDEARIRARVTGASRAPGCPVPSDVTSRQAPRRYSIKQMKAYLRATGEIK